MSKSKPVILKNIIKNYIGNEGKLFTAVDNISLEIKSGEFLTLLGPSGCGKTTTLRMIAGFEIPTSGEIFIGDDMVNSLTPDKRDTAMVFQSYAIFPHLNIYENIAYGLKLKRLTKGEIDKKVKDILELIGLSGLEKRAPNQLSGGQQQRVALARAIVMEPSVLLFDEPLSNLDAKLRVYMRSEIRRIQKEVGITSIYVTHDQSEAMSMSDRVVVMNKGIIEQVGTPNEIYNKPATEFVADFIGVANILDCKIDEDGSDYTNLVLFDKKISLNSKFNNIKKNKVVIRPEYFVVNENGKFEGVVDTSVFMGEYQEYFVNVDKTKIIIKDYNPITKKVYNAGEKIKFDINDKCIHII